MADERVPERALAVYAHPDDPEISAGGTLARWADAGTEVHVLITTRGDKGSDDPDARRAAMKDAMTQVEAILTPDQKAKLAQLRAQQQANGGGGGGWSGGSSSAAPPASAPTTPAPAMPATPAVSAAPPAVAAPAHGGQGGGDQAGGGQGGGHGGGRMQALVDQLGLDAGQQAKAQAIFAAARAKAEGSTDPDARRTAMHDAMSQLEAILRPDQKAKLEAIRAQRGGGGGGGGPGGGQ